MGEPPGERQKRVLICGRDEEIALRLASVLPDAILERAIDDEAAMLALRSRQIDLILTDRARSTRQGVELLNRINLNQTAAITPLPKVILLGMESTREDVLSAMRGRAFSYFSRPYFEAAFDEILRHAMSGTDWEDSIRVDSGSPAWLRLVARSELATADRVSQFINEMSDLDGHGRETMGFALKEILMNAMEYGGRFDRDRLVEVSYVRGKRMMLYRVRDPGTGFSLEALTHSAIANPPEEPVRHLEVRESMGLRPGGFGVLLSRKLVDELIYNERGNDVLLIKYLSPPESAPDPASTTPD